MALYAIGDLHLSLRSNKPMEIFGDGWKDYVARIREGFSVLTADDVTVLCGDLSWTTGGTPPPKWSGSLRKTA